MPGLLALIEGDLPSGRYAAARAAGGARVSAPRLRAAHAAAHEPAEARGPGATRSGCSSPSAAARCVHARFRDLPELLRAGRPARRQHLRDAARRAARRAAPSVRPAPAPRRAAADAATALGRRAAPRRRRASRGGAEGDVLALPGGGDGRAARAPYLRRPAVARRAATCRRRCTHYLAAHGAADPLRATLAERAAARATTRPSSPTEPGSAEMPSAGRPFTPRAARRSCVARGVDVAPLVLHTGVSSLERGERPYPERYRVPALTAERVNARARSWAAA